MQAILIATGENHKLLPLTGTMPTPMVPVVDRPTMVYAIELLARAGIRDIFVSLYDQADAIQRYFGNGERWNVRLHYLFQPHASGSAGAIKYAQQQLTETFIVLPADALVDLDIETAFVFHRTHGALATAILSPSEAADETKVTAIDGDGRVLPADCSTLITTGHMHTGAFIFEPAVLNYIPANATVECHTQLMTALQQANQAIYGHIMDGYWNPLVTFNDFQAAQNALLASLAPTDEDDGKSRIRYPYVEAGEIQPGIWVGTHTVIHPTARLTGPLFIGSGCRIGRDVELGPETVIGSGVVLDEGVTIQQSTVVSHTYVGQFLHLAGRVAYHTELIDVETGINIQIADPWLLSNVNPTLPSNGMRNVAESVLALLMLVIGMPLLSFLNGFAWVTSARKTLNPVQHFGQMSTAQANSQQPAFVPFQMRKFNTDKTANVVYSDMSQGNGNSLLLAESQSHYESWQREYFGTAPGLRDTRIF
jgi:NDP-sugar pyrophosphorylase family protein